MGTTVLDRLTSRDSFENAFRLPLSPSPLIPPPPVFPSRLSLTALAPAAETAEAFEQVRETVELMNGESPEEARVRLNLDAREKAWRAAGGNGCQAVAPGGLLGGGGAEGEAGGEGGGSCVVGHLVSGGRVIRAEKDSGEEGREGGGLRVVEIRL